ncbi:hypothetical protein EDD15DRAFT_2521732 [Pisolithus albus]|nr:hypothetical protein EDD15DRAFT_2521732 [Pisolithus albus]
MVQVHLLKWSERWPYEMMEQAGCNVSPATEKPSGIKYEMPVPPDTNEMERIVLLKLPSDSRHAPSSSSDSEGLTFFRVYRPYLRWQAPVDPSSRCSHFRTIGRFRIISFSIGAVSGRSIIQFPLHALLPQFYCFYVPVEEVALSTPNGVAAGVDMERETTEAPTKAADTDEVRGSKPNAATAYLSPILQSNNAGWLHESIAERNVLLQPGLPTQWPIERNVSESDPETQKSSRLIDFGRSGKISCLEDVAGGKGGDGDAAEDGQNHAWRVSVNFFFPPLYYKHRTVGPRIRNVHVYIICRSRLLAVCSKACVRA